MSPFVLVARILFAAIFLAGAPRHFTAEGAQHAAEFGVPLARLAVPLSGVMAIAGALSVAIGWYARIGAALLVAFLVPITLRMHAFWRLSDPVQVHIQQANFMKNVSMLGAAIFIACLGAGPWSLDARAQTSSKSRSGASSRSLTATRNDTASRPSTTR